MRLSVTEQAFQRLNPDVAVAIAKLDER